MPQQDFVDGGIPQLERLLGGARFCVSCFRWLRAERVRVKNVPNLTTVTLSSVANVTEMVEQPVRTVRS